MMGRCVPTRNALRCTWNIEELSVAAAAERMKAMRERRRRRGLRELRLVVPDPRLRSVRRRLAAQVAVLDQADENDAMDWIETVSEFDASANDQ